MIAALFLTVAATFPVTIRVDAGQPQGAQPCPTRRPAGIAESRPSATSLERGV